MYIKYFSNKYLGINYLIVIKKIHIIINKRYKKASYVSLHKQDHEKYFLYQPKNKVNWSRQKLWKKYLEKAITDFEIGK